MDAQPDDTALLAAVDTEPEAFALFYRRHVAELLGYFLRRTHDTALAADLCGETFAAALDGAPRFDPERGPPVAWLYGIARRLLARAERRGAVEDRARRRLGMAPLDLTDAALARIDAPAGSEDALAATLADFVRDLEEELSAAARFRATRRTRRTRRIPLPDHAAVRGLVAAVAVAMLAFVAVLALTRGGEGRVADDPPPPASPPTSVPLVSMQPFVRCAEPARESLPDDQFDGLSLLARGQHEPDAPAFEPSRLPIGAFDRRATRQAAVSRLHTRVHVVPSTRVAAHGVCGADEQAGVCLVADERLFRCFVMDDVHAGRALASTSAGTVVGIVPDGIERVTIRGAGPPAGADVVENVYEAEVDAAAGTQVEVAMIRPGDDGCIRGVAPELLDRVAALRQRTQPGQVVPEAALGVMRYWVPRIEAVVEDGARFWGGGDGVEFWVVPVVPRGQGDCAPATRACVVAVTEGERADAECALWRPLREDTWRLAPLLPGHAAIYGIVPDGVRRVRVTIDGVSGEVDARDNVVGGVLSFPYRDDAKTNVELFRSPR